MAQLIQRWLSSSLVQGGADTFVEATISTGILPENGIVYKVTAIDFQVVTSLISMAADSRVQWSFSRDSKTAYAPLSDPDSMFCDGIFVAFTTSGMAVIPQVFRYQNIPSMYLVEPTIYAQFQSAGTGLTLTAEARIYYEEVKVSEIDILRILNNRGS